jgi:error-prone DNA polymerase
VVRAHEALRELRDAAFRLIIGAEFRASCGLKLVLLAPSQRAYGQICRLITLGRRRSKKGEYRLARSDFESGLEDCLALWIAPRRAGRRSRPRGCANSFRARLAGGGTASRRR